MISRTLETKLHELAGYYPAVVVTGPRQSGKTTLCQKACVHSGVQPRLFHYREARGPQIDLLIEQGEVLEAVEIKSGATTTEDFFKNLKRFSDRMKGAGQTPRIRSHVVYGGDDSQQRSYAQVLSWRHVQRVIAD